MANYHLSLTNGSKDSGRSGKIRHDYIMRVDKFANKSNELRYSASGNMPSWAESASEFWHAADLHERSNARVYREIECSLPNELTIEQQKALVESFVEYITEKERFSWSLAVHDGLSKEVGKPSNPHFHLIFNDRVNDGIARTAERHFRRPNKNKPNNGGAEKSKVTRGPEWLNDVRKIWADMQNSALANAGLQVRVDHRSLEKQGVERLPTKHLGVKSAAMERRGIVTERGDINRERRVAIRKIKLLRNEINLIDDRIKVENYISLQVKRTTSLLRTQIMAMGCKRFDIKISDTTEIKNLSIQEVLDKSHDMMNANTIKNDIEIRPSLLESSGLILVQVDDVDKLKILDNAGYNAAVILSTSDGSYEAWIKLANELNADITKEAAELLEKEFNIKASSEKYGKLSGFYNHTKEKAFLIMCCQAIGFIAKKGRYMIEKVNNIFQVRNRQVNRIARIKEWMHTPYKKMSFIDKCIKVYQPLIMRFSEDLERCDHVFADIMIKNGYKEQMIINAIVELSPAACDDAESYAKKILEKNPTIKFILKHREKTLD